MASTLELFIGVIGDLRIANYNAISTAALVAFEVLITLGQEINYVWRSQWSIVKALYFVIRYYVLFYLIMNSFVSTNAFLSQRFCHYYNHFQIWGTVIIFPLVDSLILVRIYSLYGQSKKMGISLVVFFLTQTIMTFALIGFAWTPFESIPNPLPGILTGCVTTFTPKYALSLAFWGVMSAFQALYVGLTLYQMFGFVRTFGFSKAALTPLLTVFVRDGAVYFVIILAANLMNTFIERFGSILLAELGTFWGAAIPSIAACRLVLNLRDVTAPSEILSGSHSGVQATDPELHEMRFRDGFEETTAEP